MRVIAGKFGGRTLSAPRGDKTRPTTDRAREALFAVLGDVSGARVLDLYAGSGALGIEALSRGAARVTFVESARPALQAIAKNVAALGVHDIAAVVAAPVERAARQLAPMMPFDLVLADPPWAELDVALGEIDKLLEKGLLSPGARLVIEHPSRRKVALTGAVLSGERRWGDTAVSLFRSRNLED